MSDNITIEQRENVLADLQDKVNVAFLESANRDGLATKADNEIALLTRLNDQNKNDRTNYNNNKKAFDLASSSLKTTDELIGIEDAEVNIQENQVDGAVNQAKLIMFKAKTLAQNAYLQAMQAADAAQAMSVLNDAIVLYAADKKDNPLFSQQIISDAKNALADAQKAAGDAISVLSTVIPVAYSATHAYQTMLSAKAQVTALLSDMNDSPESIENDITGIGKKINSEADRSEDDLNEATALEINIAKQALLAQSIHSTAQNALIAAKAAVGLS